MPEIEIMRAQEIAQMNEKLRVVWIIAIGCMLAVIAANAFVCWMQKRLRNKAGREGLRAEAARHADHNSRYDLIAWQEFADERQLPESTRIVLFATVKK